MHPVDGVVTPGLLRAAYEVPAQLARVVWGGTAVASNASTSVITSLDQSALGQQVVQAFGARDVVVSQVQASDPGVVQADLVLGLVPLHQTS